MVEQALETWALGSPGEAEDTWRTESKGVFESISEGGLLDSNYREHEVYPNPNGGRRLSYIPTRLPLI